MDSVIITNMLSQKNEEIQRQNKEIQRLNEIINNKNSILNDKDSTINSLMDENAKLKEQLEEYKQRGKEQNNQQNKREVESNACSQISLQKQTSQINSKIISSYISLPQSAKKGQKLFDAFYILGIENQNQLKTSKSKILYQDQNNKTQVDERVLIEFAYPKGNKIVEITIDQTNELIHRGNQMDINDQFSIFVMRSFEDFTKESPINGDLINLYNPDKVLYGYCLNVDDYFAFSNVQQQLKVYKYQKIYCFITHFPIYSIFKDILNHIYNTIKIERIERLQQSQINNDSLFNNDGTNSIQKSQEILNDILNQTKQAEIIEQKSLIAINLNNNKINTKIQYFVPEKEKILQINRSIVAHIAKQVFTQGDLHMIFNCILLEIKIIIMCEQKSILSAIISFLHYILFPIQWPNPIIYLLPDLIFNTIDNSQSIICGINDSDQNKILQQLSSEKLILYKINPDNQNDFYFKDNQFGKKITTKFIQIDNSILSFFKHKKEKVKIITFNYENLDDAVQLLINLQLFIENNIINLLPKITINKQNQDFSDQDKVIEIMYDNIKQNEQKLNWIQQKIVKTRYFKEYARFHYNNFICSS